MKTILALILALSLRASAAEGDHAVSGLAFNPAKGWRLEWRPPKRFISVREYEVAVRPISDPDAAPARVGSVSGGNFVFLFPAEFRPRADQVLLVRALYSGGQAGPAAELEMSLEAANGIEAEQVRRRLEAKNYRPSSRGDLMMLSLAIPGLGQVVRRDYSRGVLYHGLIAGLLAASVSENLQARELRQSRRGQQAYEHELTGNNFAWAAALVWSVNVADALIVPPDINRPVYGNLDLEWKDGMRLAWTKSF